MMIIMITMTMIMMMMINMMMKIKMVIAWPIIELGDPNFAWQQIQIIPKDDTNNDDDDDYNEGDDDYGDHKDQNGHKSDNFQARSLRFCKVIDLDNTPGKIPINGHILITIGASKSTNTLSLNIQQQQVQFVVQWGLSASYCLPLLKSLLSRLGNKVFTLL